MSASRLTRDIPMRSAAAALSVASGDTCEVLGLPPPILRERKPSVPPEPAKPANNHLPYPKFIKLYEWFKNHQTVIKDRRLSQEDAVAWAAKELGFRVTVSNIRAVASQEKEAPIQFEWPGGGRTPSPTGNLALSSHIRILALCLQQLDTQLSALSPTLRADLDAIVSDLLPPSPPVD